MRGVDEVAAVLFAVSYSPGIDVRARVHRRSPALADPDGGGKPRRETQFGRRRPARRLIYVVHHDGDLMLSGQFPGAHAAGDGDNDLMPVAAAGRTFVVGYIDEGKLALFAPGGDL